MSHKESIKALADNQHPPPQPLPIPHTLDGLIFHMHNLWMVNTPPTAQFILTHVLGEFEEAAAASEAIRGSCYSEGQVFYVHNRVQDIDT